jgi:uncharacterized OB-fold protein
MSDVPVYGDPVTAPFWAAARRHELTVQECGACGARQFAPRRLCLACQSADVRWLVCSGEATVHSVTVSHLEVVPGLAPPYPVAIVALAEGPHLLTRIVGDDALTVAIDDAVRLDWEEREDAPPLPVFRRAG